MIKKNRFVLLIQPPASYRLIHGALPDEYPGIGILSLRAYLQQWNYRVKYLNLGIKSVDISTKIKILQKEVGKKPIAAAISMNWVHLSRGAIETAKIIRSIDNKLPIIIGGQHASLFKDDLMKLYNDYFDYLIIGEAENGIVEVLLQIEDAIRSYKNRDKIIEKEPVEDIDSLPFYTYENIEPKVNYYDLFALNTTRGLCPHKCIYCLESQKIRCLNARQKIKVHSAHWLVEQIYQFKKSSKKPTVTIQDPFFIFRDNSIISLTDLLVKKNVSFEELNIFTEPGAYTEDSYRALKTLNSQIVTIDFGVESGSERILRLLKRPYTLDVIIKNIENTRKLGIIPYTWWMFGLPGETREDIILTIDFIIETMKAGAIPRWVTPMILFPQTEAYKNAKKYKIHPLMHSFKDMMVFSGTEFSPSGIYPELLTHNLLGISQRELFSYIALAKKQIIKYWPRLIKIYEKEKYSSAIIKRLPKMFGRGEAQSFDTSTFF